MPGVSTDLTTINKTTVKFATWAARVTYAHAYDYTFFSKKLNKEVTAHKFQCSLVGTDETAYVSAVLKGTKQEVAAAKDKFKDLSVWELSKIKFEENVTPPFIASALKVSVDLAKSTVQPTQDAAMNEKLATVAVPPRTLAETNKITSNRHTDLMTIITEVKPARQTKRGEVRDVIIMDGSTDGAGDYAKVAISVWGDHKENKLTIGKPLVFLNLACKVDQGNKQFNHWEDSFLCEAPACKKQIQLATDVDKLQNADNTVMLTQWAPKSSMDVSGPQPLGASAFLDYTSQNANAKLPQVMQIMASMIEEPTGSVTSEGTGRIWFVTKILEFSGSAEVGVPERVALQLTGLDRTGFLEAHAAGTLQFPLLCNLRVSRSISTSASQSGASQPGAADDKKTFVNHVIQEATPMDWHAKVGPNAAYENILTLLNALPRHEEGLLFGFLSDIETDPHNRFRLTFSNGNTSKGAAVAVLIACGKKSKPPESIGDGYKIVTPDVIDVAKPAARGAPQPAADAATYNVMGFCTLTDMAKFDLNPPRGHTQRFAVALITGCEETEASDTSQLRSKTFHMDKLQILEQAEGPAAVTLFQRLRRLTMRLNPTNLQERKHNLTVEEDPERPLKKCRTLKVVPTDASLGDQDPS